jgi:hypothetical protein
MTAQDMKPGHVVTFWSDTGQRVGLVVAIGRRLVHIVHLRSAVNVTRRPVKPEDITRLHDDYTPARARGYARRLLRAGGRDGVTKTARAGLAGIIEGGRR